MTIKELQAVSAENLFVIISAEERDLFWGDFGKVIEEILDYEIIDISQHEDSLIIVTKLPKPSSEWELFEEAKNYTTQELYSILDDAICHGFEVKLFDNKVYFRESIS